MLKLKRETQQPNKNLMVEYSGCVSICLDRISLRYFNQRIQGNAFYFDYLHVNGGRKLLE